VGSQKPTMTMLQETSLLDAGSSSYLDGLYEDYLENTASIPSDWCQYFDQLPKVSEAAGGRESGHRAIQAQFKALSRHIRPVAEGQVGNLSSSTSLKEALSHEHKQIQVMELIEAYRLLGHLHANIDPLNLREKPLVPELMLAYYQLSETDFTKAFDAGSLPGPKMRTLQQIIEDLKRIYCGTFATEFLHISDSPERFWIQEQVEQMGMNPMLASETKIRILERLVAAEGLEKYLGARYPGAKRFSLEGTDSLMVALDTAAREGGRSGAKEIVICMAHRGRLNVLINLLGKVPNQLFDEFEGKHYDVKKESGDVKYHQGFSADVLVPGGNVHLRLAYNPSHLEIVTPVICGSVKAKQGRRKDVDFRQVLSVALHGDAAFAGQGVVMETLNMSQTRGFSTGGTLHIIVNNQIGFTTSNPKDARSTLYCSDIGKMMGIPVFHVNADDPEAVFRAMQLSLLYRNKFKKDVIIDLVGYRRQGHNEADEPAATQPTMYHIIRNLPTACTTYAEKLIAEKVLTKEAVDELKKKYRDTLESRQKPVAPDLVSVPQREFMGDWSTYLNQNWRAPYNSGVSKAILSELGEKIITIPKEFVPHPRVQKVLEDRRKMTKGELPLDWGYAETMAYATLVNEGFLVRLTGQDAGRGTFFHRHAVLHNQTDGAEYIPLCNLSKTQAQFEVIDSLLSEDAVMAFEYGFANTEPNGLIIWEAQFGDFANNAQVVIDQFISSGEQKWGRLCGLTLLLPHGYEGQGPEHSSARLERYLQLCAEQNMQVCVPSTPAQVFHMLRRQVIRPLRKPLIVMTPKSLLRHKLAVSTLQALENGTFFTVLPEVDDIPAGKVKRIVLCSGKVYYELLEKRRALKRENIALIRLEQLYPFPETELQVLLEQYAKAKEIVWCQEEPKNQGAWYSIQHRIINCLEGRSLRYSGRNPAAAPAGGYLHLHQEQQNALLEDALRL